MNKIEQLEKQLAEIQAKLDELKNLEPEDEIDWPQMVGRLVEVRDDVDEVWAGPYILNHVSFENVEPFLVFRARYKQARLYTGPTSINWIKHDGDDCPVEYEDGVWVIWLDISGDLLINHSWNVVWGAATHYSIIESNPQ